MWFICNISLLPLDRKLSEGQNPIGFIPELQVSGCCCHSLFQTQMAQWQEPNRCSVSPCGKTLASIGLHGKLRSNQASGDGCTPDKPAHTPSLQLAPPPLGSPSPGFSPRGLCTLSAPNECQRPSYPPTQPYSPSGVRSGSLSPFPNPLPQRPACFPRKTRATMKPFA